MQKIKNLKIFTAFLFLAAFFAASTMSSAADSKVITIKSSLECKACKDKIENGLKKISGILGVEATVSDKTVKVKYNPDKITPEKIRQEIVKLGYDADGEKAQKPHSDAKPEHKCSGSETNKSCQPGEAKGCCSKGKK
jgi:copper chaperone CopZ